jgi:PKD repeat protein
MDETFTVFREFFFLPVVLFILLGLIVVVPAYNVSYNVSPIANAGLTMTSANITVGSNMSVLRDVSVPSGTASISLTATTLTIGSTKVATVKSNDSQNMNLSTMNRAAITFPINLPLNATVTNASLKLYLSSKTTTFGAPDLIITGTDDFAPIDSTNMVVGDWQRFNLAHPIIYNQTPVTFQSWTASTTKNIYLNQYARTAIQNANRYGNEGNITISLRDQWDYEKNNSTMIWTNATAQSATYVFGSMQAVTHAQDPMLNISYYLPDPESYGAIPPTAQFSVNLTPGIKGITAKFFSQANYTQTSGKTLYYWNFIDGGTGVNSTDENPEFIYAVSGTYTVNFTVKTPYGTDQMIKTNYVTMMDPTAAPTGTPCVTCPTTSLLHYGGLEGGTIITDSVTTNTWAVKGANVYTTLLDSKFGGSSLYDSVGGGYIEMSPSASAYDIEDGNWTWDTWVTYDDINLATIHGLFTMGAYGAGQSSAVMNIQNVAGASSILLNLYSGIVTKGSYYYNLGAGEYNTGQWYHIELTRSGDKMLLFVDGTLRPWTITVSDMPAKQNLGNMNNMTLGFDSKAGNYFKGGLDETRMTVGIPRHTASFTPAIAEYTYECASGGTCSGGSGYSSGTFSNTDFFYTIIVGLAGLVLLAFVLGKNNNVNK